MSDQPHVCTPACTQMLEMMERDETFRAVAKHLSRDGVAYVRAVDAGAARRLALVASDTPVVSEALEWLMAGRAVGPVLTREICEAIGAPPGSLERIVEEEPLVRVWASMAADDDEMAAKLQTEADRIQTEVVAATVLRQHAREMARARSELKELDAQPF